jgi:amino acid adenylation domain-containing protein
MSESSSPGDVASIVQRLIPVRCEGPSNPFCEFTKAEVEQSIPTRFEKQVRLYPDRIAIKSSETILTYDALNKAANRVARAILEQDVHEDQPVALLTDQGAMPFVGMLGALKAGRMHVVLDPRSPVGRNVSLLDNSLAHVLLTDRRNYSHAREISGRLPVLNMEETVVSGTSDNLNVTQSPEAPACIIYTSGSTGEPKGVVLSHRALLHSVMKHTNAPHLCQDDRHALLANCGYSMWTTDAYKVLLNGAALFPFDIRAQGMTELASWLVREELTIYRSVPTTFRGFVDALTGDEDFHHIRLVLLAGERVRASDVGMFKRHFASGCLLGVAYGATEVGAASWYWVSKDIQVGNGELPLGYVDEDVDLQLLDDMQQDVGLNKVGEIAVRGDWLALGYWRKPDLTRVVFIPGRIGERARTYLTGDLGVRSVDGCLWYRGRKDFQVKVRGFRIEVGEVETALRLQDGIREAVVVARLDTRGEQQLVAYVVASCQPSAGVSAIRRQLAKILPDYMIPEVFVFLHTLPLTSAGKVDRRALPHPGTARPELDVDYVAPRTPVEETLAGMWAQVLGIERVGIHDDFFDLGGHSLLATQVISRVCDAFHIEASLRSIFERPTIAGLASLIEEMPRTHSKSEAPGAPGGEEREEMIL